MAERVRAGRVEGAVPELPLVGAVALERRRALDPERRDDERRQERRRLLRQMDDRRGLPLGRAALVQARRQVRAPVVVEAEEDGLPVVRGRSVLERAREVVLAVEVVTDGRCVERRAVVELDPVPELEGPVLPVLRAPLRRQARLHERAARLERDEALEDLLRHPERLAVGDERRIEIGGIGRAGEDERRRRFRRASRRADRGERGEGDEWEDEPSDNAPH